MYVQYSLQLITHQTPMSEWCYFRKLDGTAACAVIILRVITGQHCQKHTDAGWVWSWIHQVHRDLFLWTFSPSQLSYETCGHRGSQLLRKLSCKATVDHTLLRHSRKDVDVDVLMWMRMVLRPVYLNVWCTFDGTVWGGLGGRIFCRKCAPGGGGSKDLYHF